MMASQQSALRRWGTVPQVSATSATLVIGLGENCDGIRSKKTSLATPTPAKSCPVNRAGNGRRFSPASSFCNAFSQFLQPPLKPLRVVVHHGPQGCGELVHDEAVLPRGEGEHQRVTVLD